MIKHTLTIDDIEAHVSFVVRREPPTPYVPEEIWIDNFQCEPAELHDKALIAVKQSIVDYYYRQKEEWEANHAPAW